MKGIVEFLHNAGKLKNLKRKGWVLRKVPNPESVADHSFRTAVMAMLLAKKCGYDEDKCIKMALLHDMTEAVTGDFTPEDISEEEKKKLELKAAEKIFSGEMKKLATDFIEQKTPEAKFVYQLDKLEMMLQAAEYENKHRIDLGEFFRYAEKKIKAPELKKIVAQLKKK